jgi:hypothetical protein
MATIAKHKFSSLSQRCPSSSQTAACSYGRSFFMISNNPIHVILKQPDQGWLVKSLVPRRIPLRHYVPLYIQSINTTLSTWRAYVNHLIDM